MEAEHIVAERLLPSRQLELVLEKIATMANYQSHLLARAGADAGAGQAAADFFTAQVMAEAIGALADHACGEQCVGDVGDWFAGSSFRESVPKGVSHG